MPSQPLRSSDDDNGLAPWWLVGERVGLSANQARVIGDRALKKLRNALDLACLDHDWLRNEFNVVSIDEERYLALVLISLAEQRRQDP